MEYSLEFLCWCNRCLFEEDFERELRELGVPFNVYYAISASEIWRKHPCVLGIYQNFINNEGVKNALELWLTMMKKKWDVSKKIS